MPFHPWLFQITPADGKAKNFYKFNQYAICYNFIFSFIQEI